MSVVRLAGRRSDPDIGSSSESGTHAHRVRWPSPSLMSQMGLLHPRQRPELSWEAHLKLRVHLRSRGVLAGQPLVILRISPKVNSAPLAANLATLFAMDGRGKALLVQASGRASEEGHPIYANRSLGLTDYLHERAVQPRNVAYDTQVDGLTVVPWGFLDDISLALNDFSANVHLLHALEAEFPDRTTVYDGPCMGDPDALILGQYCPHVLLAAAPGCADAEDIKLAVNAIPRQRFAGLVFVDPYSDGGQYIPPASVEHL